MQLAVPVRKVSIAALSLDGVWSTGILFLKPVAETHSGPETVLDRLNDRDLFLPIQIAGERHITLLSKTHVARLLVRDGQPGDALPEDQENLRKLLGGISGYQNPLRRGAFQVDYRYYAEARRRLEQAGYEVEETDYMGRPVKDWTPFTRGWTLLEG